MKVTGRYRGTVGVVGAGRFGLALAAVSARHGYQTCLYSSLAQRAARLESERCLPEILPELSRLPDEVSITNDPQVLADSCTLVVVTVGSEYLGDILRRIGPHLDGAHVVVHAVHLLEGEGLRGVTHAIQQGSGARQVGVIAGPMHVSEMLLGLPNTAVVASAYPAARDLVRSVFCSPAIQIYPSKDADGVERAASLAQVVAFAVGLCDGLDLGAASHASVLTLGLAEMAGIGTRVGANERSFMGLAGVGRVVDAIRRAEPNYQLGLSIAGAKTKAARQKLVKEAPPEALCVPVIDAVMKAAPHHALDVPLVRALDAVLRGALGPEDALRGALQDIRMPV